MYYRYLVFNDFEKDFDSFRNHLFKLSEEIGQKVVTIYPDQEGIHSLLNSVSTRQNVKITIYDVDGNRLYQADQRQTLGVSNIDLKNFVVTSDDTILILEYTYPFSLKNFNEINAIKNIRNFSLILFFLVIIVIIIYLHNSLVKPLTALNNCFEKITPRAQTVTNPLKRSDELGDLGAKIEEMSGRLREANQHQVELIASISHDLKTPLTSIIGYLERIISGKVTVEAKRLEYETIVSQKAHHMKELIDEFNDFVLNDPGCAILNLETIPLRRFLEDICLEYDTELQLHRVSFMFSNQIPEDAAWQMDPQKIRRVFANLIDNSLRYAVGLSEIKISGQVEKDTAVFYFEDNGPGVPEEELTAIFKKFYRVDKSRSGAKSGSGLGLAICRNIIESHGGKIQAYPAAGGGLGISFSLPMNNS